MLSNTNIVFFSTVQSSKQELGIIVRTVAAVLLFTCASSSVGEVCTLSSDRLVEIAKKDSAGRCAAPRECEYFVMEDDGKMWCAIQVWPISRDASGKPAKIPGNFQTLVISNKGKVIHRTGGA